jgi:hypothetical protein
MAKSQATGKFVWHTLFTTDIAAAKKFYTQLFGWTATDMDMGPGGKYTMFRAAGKDVGGANTAPPGAPPHWMGYATVENVDAVADSVPALGGKVHMGPTDIPNVGRFAVIADPQGGVLAPFKSVSGAPKPDDGPVTGIGEFCWDELLTTDTKAATAFYGKLFGYDTHTHDMGPAGTYTMFKRGEKDAAGMLQSPMGGTFWLAYVNVNSVDASTDKARGLGAKIVVEPKDIPGFGRFAVVTDPTGASVALWKSAR